jgi:hypothetical protein
LEAGHSPDLEVLTRTFGTDIEFVLSDLFSQHEAAANYWVDGVLIDAVSLESPRVVAARGRAWCADEREQWQIPAEIVCRFSDGQEPSLLSVLIRVGNAVVATLGEHRNRNITKIGAPTNWLFEFEVSP